jgi:N-acetylated-alpha-linked acidic dipeptidase
MSRPLDSAADSLASVKAALSDMKIAARRFAVLRDASLDRTAAPDWSRLNQQLLAAERRLLDPDGLPGRPWFRHVIYAPAFTYAPELLPGVAEAINLNDVARARAQADRLAAALWRVTATLAPPAN